MKPYRGWTLTLVDKEGASELVRHHGRKVEKAKTQTFVQGSAKLPSPACEKVAGKKQNFRYPEAAI